jgi:hypothetical protein
MVLIPAFAYLNFDIEDVEISEEVATVKGDGNTLFLLETVRFYRNEQDSRKL